MHSFLQIILVQFILFFNLSRCKIASVVKNCINYVPQTAATTFAFSSVFILLLWKGIYIARRPLGLVWFGLARSYCPPSRDSRVGQLSRSSPARYRKSSSRMKKSFLKTDNEFRFLFVNEAISNRHSSMEQNCRPFPSI